MNSTSKFIRFLKETALWTLVIALVADTVVAAFGTPEDRAWVNANTGLIMSYVPLAVLITWADWKWRRRETSVHR